MIKIKNLMKEVQDDNLNKEIDDDIKEWSEEGSLQKKRKIREIIVKKIGRLHSINEQKMPSTKEEWAKEIVWRKRWVDSGFDLKYYKS